VSRRGIGMARPCLRGVSIGVSDGVSRGVDIALRHGRHPAAWGLALGQQLRADFYSRDSFCTSLCGSHCTSLCGSHPLDAKAAEAASCLASRRPGSADIYSQVSAPNLNRRQLTVRPPRQPRRGSAELRLLGGPPGRLIGRPDTPTYRRDERRLRLPEGRSKNGGPALTSAPPCGRRPRPSGSCRPLSRSAGRGRPGRARRPRSRAGSAGWSRRPRRATRPQCRAR
jgi:hypothetical protein